MKRVITYGTYDMLHHGHIRLLERAKALGDYLIVAVTTEDFDKRRGKINVKQSLMERVEAIKNTGLADEIIVEEYEGQKIDDIKRYEIDVFTVGSDWEGYFDYLREYCDVVYLERTEGISSSSERSEQQKLRLGFVGDNAVIEKYRKESLYVNGIEEVGVYSDHRKYMTQLEDKGITTYETLDSLCDECEAVYIESHPTKHYEHVKTALMKGKHVLCESPIALNKSQIHELYQLADSKNLILMDSLKTAYSTAYNRLRLLIKSGTIGQVLSVDATCTSLYEICNQDELGVEFSWNSMCAWGPLGMLPVFQMLGTNYKDVRISSYLLPGIKDYDLFSKLDFQYDNAVGTVKVGKGVKSEGELIISGTGGYIYVPAPWWKTDYFEIRYEKQENNKRYFYQLEGEGIRYEMVAFMHAIEKRKKDTYIDRGVSEAIVEVVQKFYDRKYFEMK